MEDKVFDLLAKMYTEFNQKFEKMDQRFENIDQRFEKMDQRFENIDQRFEKMDQRFESIDQKFDRIEDILAQKADKQDIARLEFEMKHHIDVLYDGYKQTYEKLTSVENKVNEISSKVEKQDVEIRVIKNAK